MTLRLDRTLGIGLAVLAPHLFARAADAHVSPAPAGAATSRTATPAPVVRRTTSARDRPGGITPVETLPGVTVSTMKNAGAARAAAGALQTAAQQAANTRAINAALADGRMLSIRGCSRIEIGSSLVFTSGSGLVGVPEAACKTPTIFMPARWFTRADNLAATRYGRNAVGLALYGARSGSYAPIVAPVLRNLYIRSEVADGRSITAIAVVNARDVRITDVEVSGIPLGVGIALQSVRGDTRIVRPYLHDFYSNTTAHALVTNAPNATGIGVGGDEVNGIVCDGVRILGARIADIRTGPAFRKANGGDQSDGINVSSKLARGTVVVGFDIRRVAEPIDNFGVHGVFSNGYIEDAFNFGFKLVHGASFNRIRNLMIVRAGLAGVVLAGSPTLGEDVIGNTLSDIIIRGVNADGRWASADSACILINDYGFPATIRNTAVSNVDCTPGANARYGWLDTSRGSGNVGNNIRIAPPGARDGKRVYVAKSDGSVRMTGLTGAVKSLP